MSESRQSATSDLATLTTQQATNHSATLLLIPLGSTEQHGPHLPLATDTIIAEEWCQRLAARNPAVLVAPALAYGAAGEHQSFAGTLSIGSQALGTVLVELARSAAHSYQRVVFVSGHAGNASAMAAAITKLRYEGHDVAGLVPLVPGGDAHAGRTETSMLLAIDPALVARQRIEPGNTEPLIDLLDRMRANGLQSVSKNGILGDPTEATAEEGHLILDRLATNSIHDDGHC